MSKMCDICGKKPILGYNVSHAHNKPEPDGTRTCKGSRPSRMAEP